ncbi:MAG: hypothetical protein ACETWQ_08085 [Phycisphaerae bacterium]
MKRKFFVVAIGMCLGMLATVIPGCATNRVDLVDQGIVSVETKPSKRVNILWTDVYRDGEDIVIYGVVQRRSRTSYPIKTHVDVIIFFPDGTILQEARTPDIYVPRRIPGKGINWKRFELRFPEISPSSKIRFVAHEDLHEDKT